MPEAPNLIRSFIAIHLPSEVLERVADFQRELRSSLPSGGVRWAHPEQIHLTLRFLGDVPASDIPEVEAALQRACESISPIPLRAAGAGCFPDARRPRVLWVGLIGDLDRLRRLHANIEQATARWDEREDREFRPHLTLGRIKQPDRRLTEALASPLRESRDLVFGEWQAAGAALMRSDLLPSGARYTKMAEAAFRGG